jgi:hypothetical protein
MIEVNFRTDDPEKAAKVEAFIAELEGTNLQRSVARLDVELPKYLAALVDELDKTGHQDCANVIGVAFVGGGTITKAEMRTAAECEPDESLRGFGLPFTLAARTCAKAGLIPDDLQSPLLPSYPSSAENAPAKDFHIPAEWMEG